MEYTTTCETCYRKNDCADYGDKTCTIAECDVCGEEVDPDEAWMVGSKVVCNDCLLDYLESEGFIRRLK